jgi:DNA-directed RNA polymerase specialized sigma24 family protein
MRALYLQATDQHRHRILSFAHCSLRVREDAEDVTQEVFIKLWQHWQKIDHEKLSTSHNAYLVSGMHAHQR